MQNTRFSFGNLFDQSQISKISPPITQKNNQQQQSYKQKYFQCKQSIKQFMQMVEKQFEELTKKHNAERQLLRKEIIQLKGRLNQKNDQISNFTVRSKRFENTDGKSSCRNRSISQQAGRNFAISFQGISAFDQSKIHSRSKSFIDKNLSSISMPNTLLQLQSVLNQKNSTKPSSILANLTENDIKNSSSLNVTEYTNQLLGRRRNKAEMKGEKEKFNSMMENIAEKNISDKVSKEKYHEDQNKENVSSWSLNKNDQKSKAQENSVRNMLKNLRSSMKSNIEKESNLQATNILSIKN